LDSQVAFVQGAAEHAYEVLYALFAFIPPYPLFKTMSDAVSIRVFTSRCCLSTTLRTALLVAGLAAEALAAFHLMPDTALARGGAVFSICHLLLAYILVWSLCPAAAVDPAPPKHRQA